MYNLYTDGAYLSEYEKAGIGGYVESPTTGVVFEFSKTITTPEILPYHEHLALESGLQMCLEHGIKEVKCFSDYQNFVHLFDEDHKIIKRLKELQRNIILHENANGLHDGLPIEPGSQRARQLTTFLNTQNKTIEEGKKSSRANKKLAKKLKKTEMQENLDEITQRIYKLISQFSHIEFCWIPRKENSKADKLSKPDLRSEMGQTNFITKYADINRFEEVKSQTAKYYVFDCSHGLKIFECDIGKDSNMASSDYGQTFGKNITTLLVQENEESHQKDKIRKIVHFLSKVKDNNFGVTFKEGETGLLIKSTIERQISCKALHSYVASLEAIALNKNIILHQHGGVLFSCFGKSKKMIKSIDSCLELIRSMGDSNKDVIEQYTGPIEGEAEIKAEQKNIFQILLKKINTLEKKGQLGYNDKQWLEKSDSDGERETSEAELMDKIKNRGIKLKF